MENSDSPACEAPAADVRRGARRRPRPRVLLVLGGALTAFALVAATTTANGADNGADNGRAQPVYQPVNDPIVGSWYAQVYFPGYPFAGRTEATMMTFIPGGGLVEANPVNESPAANSGYWKRNPDGTYYLRLLNFTWDPATSGTQQILDVDITLTLQDQGHFHSTAASAVVYFFDSKSGERLGDPIPVPDVTVTTAERFDQWQVPTAFPSQP